MEREFRDISRLGNEMKKAGDEALATMTKGDRTVAAATMKRSDTAFIAVLAKLKAGFVYLDEVGETVIAKSVSNIGYDTPGCNM